MLARLGPIADLLFPPECAGCRAPTDAPHGLCASCWSGTSFITGQACDLCGMPVPTAHAGERAVCDTCDRHPRGWDQGRAAVLYEGIGRKVLLRLKHGDRLDLARPVARWMARVGAPLIDAADVIAPVPLHWTRLARRRYNQAAELARQKPVNGQGKLIPDLIRRTRPTPRQVAMDRETRFSLQRGAFDIPGTGRARVEGRNVLLIDDVMTSGATLAACTEVLRAAGAERVTVLVAARVAREDFGAI